MTNLKFQVGDRIKFAEEKQSYRITAADDRYAVCIKPFNPRHTTLYCIVDLARQERGPDDRVFCEGYETDAHAERALGQLQRSEIEVSRRQHKTLPLNIEKIFKSKKARVGRNER